MSPLGWGDTVARSRALRKGAGAGLCLTGGGGSGTQKFVYQKSPDKILPVANFVFPHDGNFGLGGGGGSRGDPPPR